MTYTVTPHRGPWAIVVGPRAQEASHWLTLPPWTATEPTWVHCERFLTCSTCHTALCPAAILPEVHQLLHVIVKAILPDRVLILDTRVSHLE